MRAIYTTTEIQKKYWYANDWYSIVTDEHPYLEFILLSNNTYGVYASEEAKNATEIVIPSVYKGKAVTKIVGRGFNGLSKLTLTIPSSITTIEAKTLYNVPTLIIEGTNSWSSGGGSSAFNSIRLTADNYKSASSSGSRGYKYHHVWERS